MTDRRTPARGRIGGTLSPAAMAALAALRQTETSDVIEPRHFDRPVDRINFVGVAAHQTQQDHS